MTSAVLISPDAHRVRLDLDAYCHDCKTRHRLGRTLQGFSDELWEWEAKHRGHDFEFLSPKRQIPRHFDDTPYEQAGEAPWWLDYAENANVKLTYATAAPIPLTLAALATSSTFLVGRESTALDNTTNLYIDGRLTARVTTGTTPTVDTEIRLYGYAALDDTPNWPDVITGTDSNRTLTNAYILDSGLILLGATAVSSTSNITYPIRMLTVAEAFGIHPKRFGIFAAHNTAVNLHATGPHAINYIGAFITSV